MSAALKGLVTPTMNVMSIMNISSQAEFTSLQKSFSDAGINMNNFQQLYGPTTNYIQYMMNLNSVPLSFPPPKYTGNNRVKDLIPALTALKNALSPLQNNTAIKLPGPPPPMPPSWKPPPGMPQPIRGISDLLARIDDIVKLLGGTASQGMRASAPAATASQGMSPSAQAEMNRRTASAAAAQDEMNRKTASAAAAAQAAMEKKTASAAAVAAEQQRISGTLTELSSSLKTVQSTLQGGGGPSTASRNPIDVALSSYENIMTKRRLPDSIMRSSNMEKAHRAVSDLRGLKHQQMNIARRLNAAVKNLNSAAAKTMKGGRGKNKYSRKGGSRRKGTRSRSRSRR